MSTRFPSHGPWCNHKAYPRKCKCGSNVFYCFCDHGSKYFVDRLGEPWPLHRCQYYSPPLTFREIQYSKWLASEKKLANLQVRRKRALNRIRGFTLEEPLPGGHVEGKGVVAEMIREANIYTLLNIPRGSKIWTTDLGTLAHQKLTRMTVIVERANGDGFSGYQFYIPSEELKAAVVEPGDKMRFKVEPIHITRRPSIWYCRTFLLRKGAG